MAKKKQQPKTRIAPQPQHIRESALADLAAHYRDAVLITSELKRSIDSFSGPIPADSPVRYLRMTVGDAIMSFLDHTSKPQSLASLVQELEAGGCIFGAVKSPQEIVGKSIAAYVQMGRLRWMNKGKTLVALA
jgi:hypothetical protein